MCVSREKAFQKLFYGGQNQKFGDWGQMHVGATIRKTLPCCPRWLIMTRSLHRRHSILDPNSLFWTFYHIIDHRGCRQSSESLGVTCMRHPLLNPLPTYYSWQRKVDYTSNSWTSMYNINLMIFYWFALTNVEKIYKQLEN